MASQPRTGYVRVEPKKAEPISREPVEAVNEPTVEQCENVMLALGLPILTGALRPPYYEEAVRNMHALVTRMLNGDEDAARTVETLRRAFGRAAASGSGTDTGDKR